MLQHEWTFKKLCKVKKKKLVRKDRVLHHDTISIKFYNREIYRDRKWIIAFREQRVNGDS